MSTPSAAGVAFIRGKDLLVLRRSDQVSSPGTWALPGGNLERGETFLEAALREVDEEILNAPRDFIVSGEYAFRHPEMNYSMFVAHVPTYFTPVLNYEHDAYKWAPYSQLVKMRLHPGFRGGLEKIKEMDHAIP